ncbi:peptidyl-prolyl cis-trans isomerase [Cardiobacteriaceae bacterium TAE3-ERU3]|nr:peptidyl-prolyl cis-trans isomerase [Cardiobacteriaceae bacterium TAE3-ERU3]
MRKILLTALLFAGQAAIASPWVTLHTNQGDIVLELDEDNAPATVNNFVTYVKDGFYDGTVFHRVIPNFMIQGGGFDAALEKKPTRAPIANEAHNGLANDRGTIAMARTSNPHSATAQFFINVKDNSFLNKGASDPYGYAVFGKVIKGMDVADAISTTPTGAKGPFRQDVPQQTVTIESAELSETDPLNPEQDTSEQPTT